MYGTLSSIIRGETGNVRLMGDRLICITSTSSGSSSLCFVSGTVGSRRRRVIRLTGLTVGSPRGQRGCRTTVSSYAREVGILHSEERRVIQRLGFGRTTGTRVREVRGCLARSQTIFARFSSYAIEQLIGDVSISGGLRLAVCLGKNCRVGARCLTWGGATWCCGWVWGRLGFPYGCCASIMGYGYWRIGIFYTLWREGLK